jgi:hypothetical protein
MMNEPTHLIAQCFNEGRVPVTQSVNGNPGQRVEIALAGCIK